MRMGTIIYANFTYVYESSENSGCSSRYSDRVSNNQGQRLATTNATRRWALGLKRPESETAHHAVCNDVVKYKRSYTSTLPYAFVM